MEKFKIWLRKNWSTVFFVGIFILLLVSPGAKAWLMRQIISTGLLNPKIEKKSVGKPLEETPSVSESFRVKDENGKIINLSELKGKWCLLISGLHGVHLVEQNFHQFKDFTKNMEGIVSSFSSQSIWMRT